MDPKEAVEVLRAERDRIVRLLAGADRLLLDPEGEARCEMVWPAIDVVLDELEKAQRELAGDAMQAETRYMAKLHTGRSV